MKNGQKAWVYYDSYIPAAQRTAIHGLAHGGELIYVFGTLPDHDLKYGNRTIAAATPEDRRIAGAMTDAWAAFARTGDPSPPGGPNWPAYGPATDAVLEFGADGVHPRPAFHKATLDLVEQLATSATGR